MFRTEFSLQPTSQPGSQSDLETQWIVLLHSRQTPSPRTLRLLTAMGATAAHVDAWSPSTGAAAFSRFDLIVYEAVGTAPDAIQPVLQRVRKHSKAPLIVATGGAHTEASITTLQAGADAVIPLTPQPEINAAHCLALLRRWQRPTHFQVHACAPVATQL